MISGDARMYLPNAFAANRRRRSQPYFFRLSFFTSLFFTSLGGSGGDRLCSSSRSGGNAHPAGATRAQISNDQW